MKALEAVAEKARAVAKDGECWSSWKELVDAVAVLDTATLLANSLPAAPPADVVDVAVWEDTSDGEYWFCRPGHAAEIRYRGLSSFTRLGTTRLALATEPTP